MTIFSRSAIILLFVAASIPALAADSHLDLHITTNLLTAKSGAWVRRNAPREHSYTTYVEEATEDQVTIRLIYTHNSRPLEVKTVTLTPDEIRQRGIDPNGPDSRDATLEHNGTTYRVRAVDSHFNDSDGTYYISDAVPATGILCIEIRPSNDGSPISLWNDAYGTEPDDLILKAIKTAPDGDYGIPDEDSDDDE